METQPLSRDNIIEALRPREVYLAMLPDSLDRFRSVVSTFDGASILEEHPDVVNNLTIFKIKVTSMYHVFALGAIFQIDKNMDKIRQEQLAMILQNDKNEN